MSTSVFAKAYLVTQTWLAKLLQKQFHKYVHLKTHVTLIYELKAALLVKVITCNNNVLTSTWLLYYKNKRNLCLTGLQDSQRKIIWSAKKYCFFFSRSHRSLKFFSRFKEQVAEHGNIHKFKKSDSWYKRHKRSQSTKLGSRAKICFCLHFVKCLKCHICCTNSRILKHFLTEKAIGLPWVRQKIVDKQWAAKM